MSQLTLKQKQLINEHVTEETMRCLRIITSIVLNTKFQVKDGEDLESITIDAMTAIVKGQPYVKFNTDLEKMIPSKRA